MIGWFIQEDTYYGDGLNLYTYCRNNSILNHDPTGHGTKENSPYSRKEQQYIDVGADPDTARLAAECYPDANSKKSLYDKYKKQGYNAQDAKKLANYEIVHGEERAKNYAANNVKKSGPDYTATSPRENPNTDWRTQNRLNAQREAGAGKSGRETELFLPDEYYQKLDYNIEKAIAARDAEVARIQGLSKTQQSNIATVVAGVDIRTGEVYVGVKNSRTYKGNATCAEDIVFRGLGGNTNANIIMTPAIRPRNNEVIPVCTRCQTKYPQNQFVKGTTFQ